MDDAGKTVGRAWGGASERGRLRGAERRWAVAAPALLALLVLAVLGDLVLVGDGKIASHRIGDAVRSFVAQRDFGFSELRAGNLPLWNPHQFSGTPFVGTFQSAMFYPPNLVHLVLPVAAGINFEVGLHLLVLGLGTMAWARGRGLSPPAALIAAVVASFGATVSLRVLAGALSVLATYAWAPLLLRCVDELARRATLGWTLVAASAATMTLLAGHLPTAFMTALALALYCVPALFSSPRRLRFVGCLAGAAALALLLAGAQLGAGFDLARESVREGGMSFGFSTAFSFPPENLLNSVVASLFGDATPNKVRYFGRGWYWDDSVFIGAAAFSLALIGACSSRVPGRKTALVLAGCLVLLALGRHTPLYGALYRAVPGFDLFRAPSKFMFYASLFVALLVGMGAQRLLAEDPRDGAPDPPLPRRAFALGLGLLGALLLAIALWSAATIARDPMAWTPVHALAALNESPGYDAERALEHWGAMAAESATWAGASFVAVALLVWGSRARRWLAWLVLLVCVLELVFFARANRGGIASRYPLLVHARALNVYRLAGSSRWASPSTSRWRSADTPSGATSPSCWGAMPTSWPGPRGAREAISTTSLAILPTSTTRCSRCCVRSTRLTSRSASSDRVCAAGRARCRASSWWGGIGWSREARRSSTRSTGRTSIRGRSRCSRRSRTPRRRAGRWRAMFASWRSRRTIWCWRSRWMRRPC